MAAEKGSSAVNHRSYEATIQACEEQLLRSHVMFAAAGKTNLTDEQLVDLLLSAFPQSYSACNRKLLTERLAKITQLPRRRDDAIDDATNKRRKIDDTRNASGQNEVLLSSSASASSSDSKKMELLRSNRNELHDDDDEKEMKENGDDVNGNNQPTIRYLAVIGDGRRTMNRNGVGGWRDWSDQPMLSDLHGMQNVRRINMLQREVIVPLKQAKLLRHFGVEPTARILLHGPPGCGKTTLARVIANEAGVPLCEISAAELVSGDSGAPEENIRELFSTAYMKAPSIVFIDKIEPHIVNQFIACMDEAYRLDKRVNYDADSESSNSRSGHVLVIGATNKINALDPALRQWFDREIGPVVLEEYRRRDILSALTRNLKVEVGFDHAKIARFTLGYVAGDLVALAKEASRKAVNRTMERRLFCRDKEKMVGVPFKEHQKNCYRQPFSDEEVKNLSITTGDFVAAGKIVQPSSEMEGFSTRPNVNWDDVVGLQLLKSLFESRIVKRIKFPGVYKNLMYHWGTAFFLYGPSGCGKTLIVKALANEAGANFIHVKAPELLEYGDEIEIVVQNLVRYANNCSPSPCILFFDELGMISDENEDEDEDKDKDIDKDKDEDEDEDEDKDHGPWPWPDFRQIIKVIDNLEEEPADHVIVICATNRPEVGKHFRLILDSFHMILYVPLPSPEERGAILKAFARNMPIDADVDLMALGKDVARENFNGYDLFRLVQEACTAAIDRPTFFGGGCSKTWTIKDADFKSALAKIHPIVSHSEIKKFELYSAIEAERNSGRFFVVGDSDGEE